MAAGSVASAALQKPSMNAQQSIGGATFDNSGWNVNLAGAGANAQQTATNDRASSVLGLSQLLKNPIALVLLAFIAFELAKHK